MRADRAGAIVHRQLPAPRRDDVTQDVAGPVASQQLEVAMIGTKPGIQEFLDLDRPPAKREPPGCLLSAMPGSHSTRTPSVLLSCYVC
jgi:hypothetical protein